MDLSAKKVCKKKTVKAEYADEKKKRADLREPKKLILELPDREGIVKIKRCAPL